MSVPTTIAMSNNNRKAWSTMRVVVVTLAFLGLLAAVPSCSSSQDSNAKQVVLDYYQAWEERDTSLMVSMIDPTMIKELSDHWKEDPAVFFDRLFFDPEYGYYESVVINDLEVEVIVSGNSASITYLGGTVTVKTTDSEARTLPLDSLFPLDTELIKIGGKWYGRFNEDDYQLLLQFN